LAFTDKSLDIAGEHSIEMGLDDEIEVGRPAGGR
jgi:hypothetical protein